MKKNGEVRPAADKRADGVKPAPDGQDHWLPSSCYMCFNSCGIKVHLEDGVVTKIEGNPDHPQNWGRICAKGQSGIMGLYDPHRVTKPLKRTNPEKGIGVDPKWVEISWDEAIDTVVTELQRIRETNPRKLILSQLEFHGLYQWVAFANAFGTTNNVRGAAFFCGNGTHPIGYLTHGSFYFDPDFHHCNYMLLIGSQAGFVNHTIAVRHTTEMADARGRGMKVVVVDPAANYAGAKADEWIPIRPGTDAAFALSIANLLLNEYGLYDAEFQKKYTNGPYLVRADGHYWRDKETGKPLIWDTAAGRAATFDTVDWRNAAIEGAFEIDGKQIKPAFQMLKEHVRKYTPEYASQISTVPVDTIRRIAREFGEAACIGSKIVLDGKEMPCRPAAATYARGAIAHKHGMLTGYSIQMLNLIIGAIDVPGGSLGCSAVGPDWGPSTDADGMLVPSPVVMCGYLPYPLRPVTPPQNTGLLDIIPITYASAAPTYAALREPEKYKIPYEPEMLLNCRSNIMATTANPGEVAEFLKKLRFIVCFTQHVHETAEFADIVLPDTHYLERMDPPPNMMMIFMESAPDYWYWGLRQQVVDPPDGVRYWTEVLLEIVERLGMRASFYHLLNILLRYKEPQRLDPEKKYTWNEMVDLWVKSWFGPEHDLAWFKEHGCIKTPKKIEEAYPRAFIKPRIPVYLEYFKDAGEAVRKVTEENDIPWDVSDYQPLPDWKPCPSHEEKSPAYDLWAINYKLPFHTFSFTSQNPWLDDLSVRHPWAYCILINAMTAKRKGIKDGDEIWVEESFKGYKVKGKVRLSECIHPEVVGIAGNFGRKSSAEPIARGKGVHFNDLLSSEMERIDKVSAALDGCVKVKVYKA